MPEAVTIAVTELAGATREGLLALALPVGAGLRLSPWIESADRASRSCRLVGREA